MNRAVGRVLHRYDMIADGDRILLGVSGGADSMVLLWMLNERRQRIPIQYSLSAAYIDPGFEGGFADQLADYCAGAGMPLRVEITDYGLQGHSPANRENPCFLCARLRRKRLFEIAARLGCNKLALGHNKDDIIETLFLNICYAGEISSMVPRQPMFSGELDVIRPLAYADGDLIRTFAAQQGLPVFVNPCPTAATSSRRHVKAMLQALYATNPKIKGNIFRALHHVKGDYLLRPLPAKRSDGDQP